MLQDQMKEMQSEAQAALAAAPDAAAVEALRVKYLGKKGAVTAVLKQMGALSAEERPLLGALANEVSDSIRTAVESRSAALEKEAMAVRLIKEGIDVTLPGRRPPQGNRHPLMLVLEEIEEIFLGMGFEVAEGPEIEYDLYNFQLLNMPPEHPARDAQDTFYISDNILLRSHTSSVEARTMTTRKPPFRVIEPGRVFRSDAVDATHSPMFHQLGGLVVDRGITFSDLKGTLELFVKKLYGEHTKVRFRPHHFPYTEPSAEVDMTCFKCGGKGCSMCKGEGWIEILGCGQTHPQVLENCGIDSKEFSAFAFGMGLDRITMMRYNIDDMRLLFENDLRFLKQF